MGVAPAAGYNLPTPSADDPLTDPPHSTLHSSTNSAVNDLDRRVGNIEDAAPDISVDITQARLASHTVMVRGALGQSLRSTLLVPVIWNLTGRMVTYQAAKATLTTAADADVVIDIVNGSTLDGPSYDEGLQTSVLADGPLVIRAGQFFSDSVDVDGFVTVQSVGTYVAVVIKELGSVDAPGGSLTVQFDRLL